MPWEVFRRGNKYVVINDVTKRVVGTHPTRKDALAQMRALYANVPESRKK